MDSDVIKNKKLSEAETKSTYEEKITQAVKKFKVRNYEVVKRKFLEKNLIIKFLLR